MRGIQILWKMCTYLKVTENEIFCLLKWVFVFIFFVGYIISERKKYVFYKILKQSKRYKVRHVFLYTCIFYYVFLYVIGVCMGIRSQYALCCILKIEITRICLEYTYFNLFNTYCEILLSAKTNLNIVFLIPKVAGNLLVLLW